jgi:hypothetical protein
MHFGGRAGCETDAASGVERDPHENEAQQEPPWGEAWLADRPPLPAHAYAMPDWK